MKVHWYTYKIKSNQHIVAHLVDDDLSLQFFSAASIKLSREVTTPVVLDTVLLSLLLTHAEPLLVISFVVLSINRRRRVGGFQVGDDITPTLVVMETKDEKDELARIAVTESERAGRAAVAHGENLKPHV